MFHRYAILDFCEGASAWICDDCDPIHLDLDLETEEPEHYRTDVIVDEDRLAEQINTAWLESLDSTDWRIDGLQCEICERYAEDC